MVRRSLTTTYRLAAGMDICTAIMGVSRQIYHETVALLYSKHTFSFGKDVEAIVPFFTDLRVGTRPLIHKLSLVKKGTVYSGYYDRCEWGNVCEFLKDNMKLVSMKLVVEGGRPVLGAETLPEYSASDFRTLFNVRYEALEWAWQLSTIKGIRELDIASEMRQCPPSESNAMAFFAAFSACIETGFADYLRSEMLVQV